MFKLFLAGVVLVWIAGAIVVGPIASTLGVVGALSIAIALQAIAKG